MNRNSILAIGIVLGLAAGVALTEGQSPSRKYINSPERSDKLPYSNAVLVGDTLYLAGTIGIDPATGKPPADIEQEIRLALDSWKKTLAQANMTTDDLVTVQVFCPDLSLYDKFNAVYRTYFGKSFPARAFIGSGSLLRGGRFEIQGIAIKQ